MKVTVYQNKIKLNGEQIGYYRKDTIGTAKYICSFTMNDVQFDYTFFTLPELKFTVKECITMNEYVKYAKRNLNMRPYFVDKSLDFIERREPVLREIQEAIQNCFDDFCMDNDVSWEYALDYDRLFFELAD